LGSFIRWQVYGNLSAYWIPGCGAFTESVRRRRESARRRDISGGDWTTYQSALIGDDNATVYRSRRKAR
jgi:hypothetical protein